MSNSNFKKERELETLSYFNQVYEEATADFLEVVKSCERPDFICKRNDGTVVGVELVSILRGHPNDRFTDQILNKNYCMEPGQAINLIQIFSSIKEEKRQSKGWRHSGKIGDTPLISFKSHRSGIKMELDGLQGKDPLKLTAREAAAIEMLRDLPEEDH